MTKNEFINFVVMDNWTKRELFSKYLDLVLSDFRKKYKAKRKRIRYIVMGM